MNLSVRRALGALAAAAGFLAAATASAQNLLVPMDAAQGNHLRAYGLTYWVLEGGASAEWLLNYRGGAFLLPDTEAVRREAAFRGVDIEPMDAARLAAMRATIERENMDAVPLETAPQVAIYTPPNMAPWDDAVTMALTYAEIPYETVWDPEVLEGAAARLRLASPPSRGPSPASTRSSTSRTPERTGSRRRLRETAE